MVLTALLSVAALFIITKIMGHKQVAQFDFFDYVSGITIGSIGAELATELEEPQKPLIALAIYGVISLILNLICQRLPKTRKYLNGAPTILMDNGIIYRKNFKKAKLDLSEFMMMCRERGFFDLDRIQTAVFEYNGKLSILPKSQSEPLTPKDISLSPPKTALGVELIMDGRIMGENLSRMGRDAKWLRKCLKKQGYPSEKSVQLAVYHPDLCSLSIYGDEQ